MNTSDFNGIRIKAEDFNALKDTDRMCDVALGPMVVSVRAGRRVWVPALILM